MADKMRVTALEFGRDENPEWVTVRMPVSDAAAVVGVLGHLSADSVPPGTYESTSGLADLLEQRVFLPYWEEGVRDYHREPR